MTQKNKQLIIILILPILSVLIGYFGVKFYLQSNDLAKVQEQEVESKTEEPVSEDPNPPVVIDNTEEPETEEVVAEEVYTFDALKIYAVQAGAFSTKTNADQYKKEMNDKGFGGHVYQTSKYKVYVSAFTNEIIAREYAQEFNAVVEGAYATAITLENEPFNYPAEEKDAVSALDGYLADYLKVVDRLNTVMVNDFSQEFPLEHNDFLDLLDYEKKNLNTIREGLASLTLDYKESKAVKGSFNTLLEELIAEIEKVESSDRKSNWMMTDLLMNTAFGYSRIN